MCKHRFELISKTVLPSPLEQMKSAGLSIPTDKLKKYHFRKTTIHFLVCMKCSAFRKEIIRS